jgi:release factor glutamine methyltransferase
MITYREMLQTARSYLIQHDIADADVDAWYLLAHVFGLKRAEFMLHREEPVPEDSYRLYFELVEKRASHIPLQHITGTQDFMGLEFHVNREVLIPRQDTETLVEEVLKVCAGKSVLDMCTGSGCIIISLAKLGSLSKAAGADISSGALEVAAENADKNKVKVEFIQSDLFDRVEGTYDIIVSNPPYIPTGEIPGLMPEVRDHEPITALDGDADGLMFYRRIASFLKEHLRRTDTSSLKSDTIRADKSGKY